ncbi:STY4526/YPO1902 family pathogenicity island replication protein [Halorhodospira abdelmalekii]|uniref:STY4526/YPO1902 family pathogenicity island replication protein n=1 Tax=Halorhodospira abdelmalekii TaxID=421629 RepID=UPI001907B92F|nr:STY4526/YPO1902 family pathogenicity island replication protein [Halorhodospira abdelmalekii]
MVSAIPTKQSSDLEYKIGHEAIVYALERQQDRSIREIEDLTYREYLHLLCHAAYFVEVRVHPDRLAVAIQKARRRAQDDELIDDLLRHQAHGAMMEGLFGLKSSEVAQRRRELGVVSQQGRPRRLEPTEADAVWASWKRHAHLPLAERYLRVARQCRVTAQAVWQLVLEAEDILEDRGP